MVGNDLHITAIVGAKQLKTEGQEYDIEADWVDHTPKPPRSRNIGAQSIQASISSQIVDILM